MKWPYTTTESAGVVKYDNYKQNFQRLASILLKIKLPYPFETISICIFN